MKDESGRQGFETACTILRPDEKGVTSITQRKENETQEEKGIQADQLEPERQQSSVTGGVSVNQAARKLYAYEETGLTPQEILNLMERERNLTMRVEKLEGWG